MYLALVLLWWVRTKENINLYILRLALIQCHYSSFNKLTNDFNFLTFFNRRYCLKFQLTARLCSLESSIEMYGPESVLVPYLYDGPGAVVELERETAVDHEASVEAPEAKQRFIFFMYKTMYILCLPRFDFNPLGFASRCLLHCILK